MNAKTMLEAGLGALAAIVLYSLVIKKFVERDEAFDEYYDMDEYDDED